jgi:hypothetical protein
MKSVQGDKLSPCTQNHCHKNNPTKELVMKALKIILYVVVAYLTVIGSLYLFFPNTAENAFGITLSDRSTAMLHGFGNLVMAFLIHSTASNLETYRKLVAVFQVFAAGEALIFAFQWLSDMYTFAQVGPPMIIWTICTVLLFVFSRK